MRILVLLSGLAAHGGLQRHDRLFCAVLRDYAARYAAELEVLALFDPPNWYDERYLARPLVGCNGNRAAFAMQALKRLARPCDLLVSGYTPLGPLALGRLGRQQPAVLAVVHGIEVWKPLPVHQLLGLRAASRVVSVSDYTAGWLVKVHGVAAERVRVVPNALSPEWIACMTPDAPAQLCGASLLTIARMNRIDADKGIDTVIRALPAIKAQVPGLSYTIVGDGDDRPRLEHLATTLGVADIVHFTGKLPDATLHTLLASCDVFVMPSRKEGFGIVFLEAAAYGKPVIAGAHGGSPEVVIDGETGLLVGYNDDAALAQAAITLLNDAARRQAMGKAAAERLQRRYSYQSYKASVEHVLDEMLAA